MKKLKLREKTRQNAEHRQTSIEGKTRQNVENKHFDLTILER